MTDQERIPDPTTLGAVKPAAELTADRRPVRWVGEYELIQKIGGGGMGVVYDAIHVRLKRRVAVKLLPERYLTDAAASRRFFREMEAAGRLEHPHVVHSSDAGVAEGVPYLVMEFVRGADLARVVLRFGPLPPRAALEAIQQVSEALLCIHSHQMVHRDIKPSNLLLSDAGIVKVADLGLAMLLEHETDADPITATGEVVGTVDYMAPEQAQDPRLTDHRADLYGLGCCLHFLLCGVPVYGEGSRVDRLIAHRANPIPGLGGRCPIALPKSVNRLYHDLLQKDPARRPQSVKIVLERLQECRDDLDSQLRSSDAGQGMIYGGKRLSGASSLQETARTLLADTKTIPPPPMPPQPSTVLVRPVRPSPWSWPRIVGGGLLLAAIAVLVLWKWPPTPQRNEQSLGLVSGGFGVDERSASPQETHTGPLTVPPSVLDAGSGGAVFNVHFTEDGTHLLACGSDGIVRVWNLATCEVVHTLEHDRGRVGQDVIDVTIVPDTNLAVTACYNGTAVVWDWKNDRLLRTFTSHVNQVEGVAWISGVRMLSTGGDDAMYVWNADTGEELARLENSHTGGVRAIAISPDTQQGVTADYNGNVLLWNLEPGHERFSDRLPVTDQGCAIWSVNWVPGTNRIVLGGIYRSSGALLLVYDVQARQVVREFTQLAGRVNGVRVSRDGQTLFSAADDVCGWSLTQTADEPLFEFTDHRDEVFCVDQSPNGRWLATGGTDGTVRIVDWRLLLPAADISRSAAAVDRN